MTLETLRQLLEEQAEPGYRDFASSLIPEDDRGRSLLGVRLPRLRQLARNIAREEGPHGVLHLLSAISPEASVDEVMVLSMLPGYLTHCPVRQRLDGLTLVVPQLSNWSLCDSCCATCRFVQQRREEVWQWLQPLLCSPDEYPARFGIVMMLQHYLKEDAWAPQVAEALQRERSRAFYADMAAAWCLCELAIQHPRLAESLLEEGALPARIQALSRRKMRESRRYFPDSRA